jgi:hypothetical protein
MAPHPLLANMQQVPTPHCWAETRIQKFFWGMNKKMFERKIRVEDLISLSL